MRRITLVVHRSVCALTVLAALITCAPASAQDPNTSTVEGYITAVDGPTVFQVKRTHVVVPAGAQFVPMDGPAKQKTEMSHDLAVGMYVRVTGKTDFETHDLVASFISVRNDADRTVSGKGVIDRVISAGAEPVFRADGYALRITPAAQVEYSGGLTALTEVGPNTWVRFDGKRTDTGEVVVSKAQFIKAKMPHHKHKISTVQETSFPPGSMIDFDGSFQPVRGKHRLEDAGGWCGWYPVPTEAALQERVRRIGMSLVPKYQRDMSDDDPMKIPFRFYAVEDMTTRSDIFCTEGLVMVTNSALQRVENDDQLAAILADGIAGQLQQQQDAAIREGILVGVAEAAIGAAGKYAWAGASVGGAIVQHEFVRRLEDERGRIALGLMQDAGYDPWQAPEIWRRLAAGHLPKNLNKLKYPARSEYLLSVLGLQYKRAEATNTIPGARAATSSHN